MVFFKTSLNQEAMDETVRDLPTVLIGILIYVCDSDVSKFNCFASSFGFASDIINISAL